MLDTLMVKDPADYGFLSVMAVVVQLCLEVETALALNETDFASGSDLMGDFARGYGRLARTLRDSRSLYSEMLRDMFRTLLRYDRHLEAPRVIALKEGDMEHLRRLIPEMGSPARDAGSYLPISLASTLSLIAILILL